MWDKKTYIKCVSRESKGESGFKFTCYISSFAVIQCYLSSTQLHMVG